MGSVTRLRPRPAGRHRAIREPAVPPADPRVTSLAACLNGWFAQYPQYNQPGKAEAATYVLLGHDAPGALAASP
jgi:hypothetical protein